MEEGKKEGRKEGSEGKWRKEMKKKIHELHQRIERENGESNG